MRKSAEITNHGSARHEWARLELAHKFLEERFMNHVEAGDPIGLPRYEELEAEFKKRNEGLGSDFELSDVLLVAEGQFRSAQLDIVDSSTYQQAQIAEYSLYILQDIKRLRDRLSKKRPVEYRGLAEKGSVAQEYLFHANFVFEGFQPTLTRISLSESQFEGLTARLTADSKHHPQEALVVFDEQQAPRLVAVFGEREIWKKDGPLGLTGREVEKITDDDYLHIYRVNPEDAHIFVEGEYDLHEFEDRSGFGFEASYYIPSETREKGTITIRQKGGDLVLKAEEGK